MVWLLLAAMWGGDAPAATDSPGAKPAPGAATAATDLDKLVFDQEKVEREMSELEIRMFRLGESLATLEPENSSRLRLALKYARDELIQLKMKVAREALGKKNFGDAANEQKATLQRLQRLEDLLLARDLDFQMKLERLRKMNDVLRQLEQAITEEQRQLAASQQASKPAEELAKLQKRQETLAGLIARQQAHNQARAKLAPAGDAKAEAGKQGATGQATAALNQQKLSAHLAAAANQMEQAAAALKKNDAAAAAGPQKDALAALEKERATAAEQAKKAAAQNAAADLKQQQQDEKRNQRLSEDIASGMRQLGQSGAAALNEVQQASGSQGQASDKLGQGKPGEAGSSQQAAKQALEYAKQQLRQEREKLLAELHPDVKARVVANLEKMLEQQLAVRTGTEAAKGVLGILVKLAEREEGVGKIADETIFLCEETEFSIALPDALRVVREMVTVASARLGKGDGGPAVVEIEKRVEDDLRDLLESMKKMPSKQPPKPGKPCEGKEKQEQLNKLIAELKMIRMMQKRVNGETTKTFDGAPAPPLPQPLRELAGRLEKMQLRVRDTTARLSEQRENPNAGGDGAPAP